MLAQKVLSIRPSWKSLANAEFVQIVSPLDLGDLTVEGLQFRASAHIYSADRAVTFQIEYHPVSAKGGPISRVEWRPRSPHGNKGIGPDQFRFIEITGSHVHPFGLNWDHSETLVRRGVLPIAVPISPDPESYDEALAFVEKEFRIKGIIALPMPPWTDKML